VPATASSPSVFAPIESWLDSAPFHVALQAFAAAALVVWFATVLRMHRDARRRIARRWLAALASLLGLVPFVGPLLWTLVRPPEPMLEVLQRELEMRAFAAALGRDAADGVSLTTRR
jgi:hypothetical protein